ncbi:hypothetical protein HYPSUDRAFT_35511 [Hypholoma sublateritium FD-334 SS-4]|uniref:Uncharacterized protein n=1 Tax=Hypholoma sublateritium (strain FD-334 SS-4) TaxID=945553 RepID=A0A0D2Q5Y7_HYPSF|nr:hypothetical protein HYPSUDRAFT_35511 [Hypholoma sublateritium FD-334 SS-4]
MLFKSLLASFIFAGLSVGNPVIVEDICKGSKIVTSTQFIGVDKNVKLEHITCDVITDEAAIQHGALLQPRQAPADVCGDTCTTICFTPSGGGPDPNDCHIIADALRFQSQNIAPVFTVTNGTNNILSLSFATCTSFFLNQATTPLSYCRTDFASLVDFIAPNCQATQNAHGGLCVATDGRWFVQVQHS